MGKAVLDVSMSLDGFITGPHVSHELPLGQGGEQLHDWTRDAKEEMMQGGTAATIGAIVTGRRTYNLVDGWGGRGHRIAGVPVFVLTHRVPATVPQGPTPFIFITEGMVSAIEQAKKAAGDKQVYVMGSASLAGQCLQAGLLDEILLHLVPLLLGQGIRLFDHIGITPIQLESVQVIEEAAVTHLRYRVVKEKPTRRERAPLQFHQSPSRGMERGERFHAPIAGLWLPLPRLVTLLQQTQQF